MLHLLLWWKWVGNFTCAVVVLEAAAGPTSMLWNISYTVLLVLPAIIVTTLERRTISQSLCICFWKPGNSLSANTVPTRNHREDSNRKATKVSAHVKCNVLLAASLPLEILETCALLMNVQRYYEQEGSLHACIKRTFTPTYFLVCVGTAVKLLLSWIFDRYSLRVNLRVNLRVDPLLCSGKTSSSLRVQCDYEQAAPTF